MLVILRLDLRKVQQPPIEGGPKGHLLDVYAVFLLVDDDDRIAPALAVGPALEVAHRGLVSMSIHKETSKFRDTIFYEFALSFSTRNTSFFSFLAAREIHAPTWLGCAP